MSSPLKVCVVTGTRAEYGLLRWIIDGIGKSQYLELQVVVTGSHLSPEFGCTISEILGDSVCIDRKVEILLSSDTSVGVAKSMGLGLIGFSDVFDSLTPDLCLVLGDRFEIFAASAAALALRIPIAHCHGGELTEGCIDDAMRHCISKMSNLHFVATDEYRERVVRLGENPSRVFNVGGLGVDSLKKVVPLDRYQLEEDLGFKFRSRNLLITFHSTANDVSNIMVQVQSLLDALSVLEDTGLLFTLSNADAAGRSISNAIREFCVAHPCSKAFNSLGFLRYASCMRIVDGVIGNSSSGLLEAPAFGTGTINIGDRQDGRLKAISVIDSPADRLSILSAIDKLYSAEFQENLLSLKSPYGDGGASAEIVRILESLDTALLHDKKFYEG